MNITVYLLTLGCDKNRVDGEIMLGRLVGTTAFLPIDDPAQAEVIIVNTCGFIREATQESIDTILEMASYKLDPTTPCKALIVTGCMAERYKEETKTEMPEIDAVLGVKDTDIIVETISQILSLDLKPTTKDLNQIRAAATSYTHNPHIAHIKISDGCDNACTYCTIPSIRGAYKSRPMEDILAECRLLLDASAKELVLVAQDTALYGTDIYGEPHLHKLMALIAALPQKPWIRLMYAYPEHITREIIQTIAITPNICKYIDMPIQHSETDILISMGRQSTKEGLIEIINTLRKEIPGIAIRTTIMVGFPGETVEDYRNLYNFVKEVKFDRLGVFPYSREEGTPAALMSKQVKPHVKQARLEKLMTLQQKIHQEKQQTQIGHTLDVIIDESPQPGIYVGRSQHDAYEVDAVISFTSNQQFKPGDLVKVNITDAIEYDLQGVLVK
ncbi:MAG: 30S ribosomal protein S12 methylthiotransferase RimO [Defluviitaleaceae bacterium]|nr:30S ribosomal protein S12 methylthiotransferase RimO [Defluviitaleaceae bacterium]